MYDKDETIVPLKTIDFDTENDSKISSYSMVINKSANSVEIFQEDNPLAWIPLDILKDTILDMLKDI